MPENEKKELFAHPFSKDYWHTAALEMKSMKVIILAALFIALRIAVASFFIPVAEMRIYFGFFVNALGAMIYGPVVALFTGFASDILGYIVSPTGAFFPGYVLTSMMGSFLYAVFLYRARVSIVRILLAKLSVNVLVNVGLGSLWSSMIYANAYIFYVARSVAKNMSLLPFEVIALVLFMQIMVPIVNRYGLAPQQPTLRLPVW